MSSLTTSTGQKVARVDEARVDEPVPRDPVPGHEHPDSVDPSRIKLVTGYNAAIGEASFGGKGGKSGAHGRYYLNLGVEYNDQNSTLGKLAPRISLHSFSRAGGEPTEHFGRHVVGVTWKPFTEYGELIGEFRTMQLPQGLIRQAIGTRINNPLSFLGSDWGWVDITMNKDGRDIGAVLLVGKDLGKFGSAELLIDHVQPWTGEPGTHSDLSYFIGKGFEVDGVGRITPALSIQRNDYPGFHEMYGTAGLRLQLDW